MKTNTRPATTRSTDLASRLQRAYAGAVYDVLRTMGNPAQALPHDILPLRRDQVLAGPVFTVEGRPVRGLGTHESLLRWTALLSKAPAGHVVVCQPHDHSMAHMGELSAETLHVRGIRGYIVDGGCRDTDFIERLGFKVFFRYTTPVDVVGRWRAERFDRPITIGHVRIHPGDYVFADRDGVLIIPKAIAGDVVDKVERVIRTENRVRRAIVKEKMDPQEAYLRYGKF